MGKNTNYGHFYKPALGASGATELATYNAKIDATDIQIEKSKLLKGLDADKPAASLADRLYWATDTLKMYKDSGTKWEEILVRITKTGDFTAGKITKINNASGIIEMATNTDTEVADAVDKRHTQNTDTDLDPTFEATFAKKADKLSVFAATTSAELAGVISDEVGEGKLIFGNILPSTKMDNWSTTHLVSYLKAIHYKNQYIEFKVGAYAHGATAVNYAYAGGVYSPTQNRIYLVPLVQADQTNWHYIQEFSTAEIPPSIGANCLFNKF